MLGYKGFDTNLCNGSFQFTEGETYEMDGPLIFGISGYHFCDVPIHILNEYNQDDDKYAIIEALGEIQSDATILVTNKIKIVKIISKKNLYKKCATKYFKVFSGEYHFKNRVLHRDNDLPAVIFNNGDQLWYECGIISRKNDLPAVICKDGTQLWYKNDYVHRDNDLPAIIFKNGDQFWYQHGFLHRENDLPAVICKDGTQQWYCHGFLHRENDLAAVICKDGTQKWYCYGDLHRSINKPAVIHINGYQAYYNYGYLKCCSMY